VGGFFLAVLPYAFITRDYLDCNETGVSDENISDSPFVFLDYYFENCFDKHGFKVRTAKGYNTTRGARSLPS